MQYGEVAMETPGSAKFEHQIIKKWLTAGLLCQTKTSLSNLKKMRKTKTQSYTDLVKCLANMGDSTKSKPKNGRIRARTTR